jgi:hypothetical protein
VSWGRTISQRGTQCHCSSRGSAGLSFVFIYLARCSSRRSRKYFNCFVILLVLRRPWIGQHIHVAGLRGFRSVAGGRATSNGASSIAAILSYRTSEP